VESPVALRQPDFRAMWLAGLISDTGDWMLLVALPIVVYTRTGSTLGTSAAFLAELVPGIVLAPLAGRLADRVDRRAMMLALALLQAVALAPLLLVHGRSGLVLVYVVIVVQASATALFDPAKNALLPSLVGLEQLVSANALVGLGAAAGRLAGGPLGGLLLAAGDLRTIVVADAASFLLAAALIARGRTSRPRAHLAVSEPPPPAPPPPDAPATLTATPGPPPTTAPLTAAPGPPPTTAPLTAAPGPPPTTAPRGFLAALHGRQLRGALLVAFCAQIAQGIFLVLFIVFVARRLGGGPGEIGLLRGVQAIGAIAAGALLAISRHRPRPAGLVAAASGAFGLISLTVWNAPLLSTDATLYVALFVIVGAPGVVFETGLLSLLQSASRVGERGRVMSAAGLAESGGQAVGMLAAGLLTGPLGLAATLDLQGTLYLVAGGLAVAVLGRPFARLRPRLTESSA
jgi:MFS family permease